MERLTSRKNEIIRRIRLLGADPAARRETGEFVCDGEKLLDEALRHGAEITRVLWAGGPGAAVPGAAEYSVPQELLDYVSPLKHAARVVFTAKMRRWPPAEPGRALVLETVQDPGNLGTILRTANALRIDTVILTGDCADPWGPKTVRAGMGAAFRQRVYEMEREEMRAYLSAHGLRLYGAALSDRAADIRTLDLKRSAVAIGSEGRGLSPALRSLCDGEAIIPMNEDCESLNAAVAAAIIMWELAKNV
ncbi:MAG: RNA methyltransferase [Oscillospiraceae bacterium]|nr:RNA methyltransferase [Oscillospiraceae bacterium]